MNSRIVSLRGVGGVLRPGFLRNLDENTPGCARMDERNEVPTGADSRHVIDQARAGGLEARERRVNVVDAVADVVDAGSSPGEKFPDGSLGTGRLEKLDTRRPDRKHADIDALIFDGLTTGDFESQGIAIERERLVNGRHGDAKVVDSHKRGSITEARTRRPAGLGGLDKGVASQSESTEAQSRTTTRSAIDRRSRSLPEPLFEVILWRSPRPEDATAPRSVRYGRRFRGSREGSLHSPARDPRLL